MSIAAFSDIEIYYEMHGQGEPLILIAGYGCDHVFWSGILTELAAYFKVIVFDNRAIGQTKDKGMPFTLETLASDVMQLSDHLGLIKPIIIGQSMGGAIAQVIAVNYPDKISQLIILNSTQQFSAVSDCALSAILALRKLDLPLSYVVHAILPWIFSNHFLADSSNIRFFTELALQNPYPQSAANQERQLNAIRSFNVTNHLYQIQLPTLIIASENDILTPPTESRALANLIANAVLRILPGAHALPLEHPDLVSQTILSFLLTD